MDSRLPVESGLASSTRDRFNPKRVQLLQGGLRLLERRLLDRPFEGDPMLYYALMFLVVAIVAAIFGFGGIAVNAAGIAKMVFFLCLIMFFVSGVVGLQRRA
jgi:uncharacterized membrane protein YtjA (UPF0391 family)